MADDPTTAAQRSDPPESKSGPELALTRSDQGRPTRSDGVSSSCSRKSERSFGTVYQAHDPRLDRAVAVKLVRSQSEDEHLGSILLHEGRTLARVRHPNVVTVYGAGEHDGQVGLWMELIRGVTLEHMLMPTVRSAQARPGSSGRISAERWQLCTAPGSFTGTSEPRTSCANKGDVWC